MLVRIATAIALVSAVPVFSMQESLISESQESTAEQLIEMGLASDSGYEIVRSLTTEVGPRLGGSRQEARARDWAVQMFTELGFENVRIEPFEMPYWDRGAISTSIVAPFPQPLRASALGGSAATPQGGIEAEIVFFESFEALRDFDGSLENRIAYVNDRMISAQTGAGYGPANQKRRFAWLEAEARGALGVMIRSVGTDSHRFPHTGMMSTPNDGTINSGTHSDVAIAYIREEHPDYAENRMWSSIPAVALSAPDADQIERIHESGESVTVRLSVIAGWRGSRQSGNVVAEIPGRERPEEIVLIGAHLDSWDEATGAVDDGAGVGIVTAAAHLIDQLPRAPRRTIRVVLFGAEEVGLLGAFAYARDNSEDIGNIVLASESDFGAGLVWSLASGTSEEGTRFMDEAQQIIAPLGIIRGDRASNGGGPDIIPLAARGVPVFRLNQDGTDYFDLHHTPDDTFDKIDPDSMAQNVAAWAAITWLAAETDVEFRTQDE
ncbi:M28 family peptidase [Hyphobacterium sp. HN65]|uniref:Carboxypeptidase Q n=1 Tax=Hyphobacterium lacteum TaxID=3116575 RepID=A0ABU7LUE1_9PROT|nr:M28 family peptidase [Hyphobacterium sp. HN65]MEE2527236.1 M28 family peptidase [Hyphobacterium sp. HN65]